MSQKKSVLITGVAGFIGSNLLKRLLQENFIVIGIDNFSQGCKRNIQEYFKDKNFTFIKADVRNEPLLKKQLQREKIDYLVHLAAYKIPRYGNAMDTLLVNAKGTESMLNIAKDKNAKFIFTSTSDVYGKNDKLPFSEESNLVLGPSTVKRWAYASSKIFDEHLCFAFEEKYKLKICILRLFGSYGPNQNLTWWGGPQSVFINAALRNIPMEIHGNGLQTRSFTYVDDTIDGVVRAIKSRKSCGEIFNIGNNKEISIINLAKLVWKLIRKEEKPKIKFIPYASFSGKYQDVRRRIPDISKANKLLGFMPRVDLREGLLKTIEWQESLVEC
ncbi:MAG: GDP-mannose 4,6-dehydratase [Patescibacteria group bacterium]